MLKSAINQANKLLLKPKNLVRIPSANNSEWVLKDKMTHTGQQWEADDYRLARFIDNPKHVNTQFPIDLIAEEPPKGVNSRVVACDGGGGSLGHPKVYINLDKPGNHACGYCGLRFYLKHVH